MIYITHDQAEAMALADRIAVMDKGRILQVATPSQLYREPADETVARFIGEGMIVPIDNAVADGSGHCIANVLGHRVRLRHADGTPPTGQSRACVRESALRLVDAAASGVNARVTAVIYQGGHFRVEALADAAPRRAAAPRRPGAGEHPRRRSGEPRGRRWLGPPGGEADDTEW